MAKQERVNMRSKRGPNSTRGPNADERRFASLVKERPCCCCQTPGPSIVQHCFGAKFKHNKTLIGHRFIIPLCPVCDSYDTQGSHRAFSDRFGPQADLWVAETLKYNDDHPQDVTNAIIAWGR